MALGSFLQRLFMPKREEDYMLSSGPFGSRFNFMPDPDENSLERIKGMQMEGQEEKSPYSSFFDEETPALEGYRKHLESMPQRENFKQGLGSKLLTALAAGATGFVEGPSKGIALAQSLRDRPYKEAFEGWEAKGKGLGERAGLEVRLGESKRKFAQDVSRDELAQKDYIRKLDASLAQASSQERRDAISAELADARKKLMDLQGKHIGVEEELGKRRERTREGFLGVAKKKEGRLAKGEKGKDLTVNERARLEGEAARRVAMMEPGFKEFYDEKTGKILPPSDPSKAKAFASFEDLIEQWISRKTGKGKYNKGMQVNLPSSLPDIEDEEDETFETIP